MTQGKLVDVEFVNVTITVPNVETAEEAYEYLAEVLDDRFSWSSDSYRVLPRTDADPGPYRDTSELF